MWKENLSRQHRVEEASSIKSGGALCVGPFAWMDYRRNDLSVQGTWNTALVSAELRSESVEAAELICSYLHPYHPGWPGDRGDLSARCWRSRNRKWSHPDSFLSLFFSEKYWPLLFSALGMSFLFQLVTITCLTTGMSQELQVTQAWKGVGGPVYISSCSCPKLQGMNLERGIKGTKNQHLSFPLFLKLSVAAIFAVSPRSCWHSAPLP